MLTLLRISTKLQKKLLAGIPKETVLSKEQIMNFLEPLLKPETILSKSKLSTESEKNRLFLR
jgi:hypothetical protein